MRTHTQICTHIHTHTHIYRKAPYTHIHTYTHICRKAFSGLLSEQEAQDSLNNLQVSKGTYSYGKKGKRDLFVASKETYLYGKRGLLTFAYSKRRKTVITTCRCQRRPICSVKRDLFVRQKRPINIHSHTCARGGVLVSYLSTSIYRMCSLTIECVLLL